MKIIGCDFHPGYQQIAMLDLVTGEMVEKAQSHERKEEVRAFYAGLEGSVRARIEASGQSQWFKRMLAELGHGVGTRGVDRGCSEDSRQLRAEAEDGPARRGAIAEASGGRSLSADLGTLANKVVFEG